MYKQLGIAPARRMFWLAVAVAAALAGSSVAAAQNAPKVGDVLYRSASVPVWLAVQNTPGTPDVFANIVWDEADSKLRFSTDMKAGDLVVTVGGCAHPGETEEHGSSGFRVKREDVACRVSDPAVVSVSHLGWPMKCVPAEGKGAAVQPDGNPHHLFFGCYWSEKPGGGD